MNKKFANLGTVLSREQAKKVMGGNRAIDLIVDDGGGACSTGSCTYMSAPVGGILKEGTCTTNTNPMQSGCACKKSDGTLIADSGCNLK